VLSTLLQLMKIPPLIAARRRLTGRRSSRPCIRRLRLAPLSIRGETPGAAAWASTSRGMTLPLRACGMLSLYARSLLDHRPHSPTARADPRADRRGQERGRREPSRQQHGRHMARRSRQEHPGARRGRFRTRTTHARLVWETVGYRLDRHKTVVVSPPEGNDLTSAVDRCRAS